MSTLLGLDKTADYATLREWCLTVLDFLNNQDSQFLILVEYGKKAIADIDKKQNLKKMRAMYKETYLLLNEDHINSLQLLTLNEILKEKFSHCLADVAEMETKAIEKIIKRGRIRNDTEYRLVWQREDEIYTDDSQFEYAETLRKLLSDYEDQKEIK
ncbi:MAG: hypothetical protein IKH64_09300 [Prevotella sp.]|nr:hypothetical protein [Prevotella sp.]